MLLENSSVRVQCRRVRNNAIALRYICPITGSRRSVPTRKSGVFATKEEAFEWAKHNLQDILDLNQKFFLRQTWRSNKKLLRYFLEYKEWRKNEYERSGRFEVAVLTHQVFPFFVTEMGLSDPNKWGHFGEEFRTWLKETARSRYGKKLAISTAQRAISAANQYLKWLRRKKYISYFNYRPIEIINPRNIPKRDFRHLVSDEVFEAVHDYLKTVAPLYADMWYVQRKIGCRISELLGIAFHWLSEECPTFIAEEFEKKQKVYGSIFLQSQIADQTIIRDKDGNFPRAPLKSRPEIGLEYSRTIPVTDEGLWEILLRRHEEQSVLWDKKEYGENKDNYVLFDGAKPWEFRDYIKDAYAELGLESTGTHILRHTLSTEWTALKINEKVSELVLGHKSSSHQRYVHIVAMINAERAKAKPVPRLRKNVEK